MTIKTRDDLAREWGEGVDATLGLAERPTSWMWDEAEARAMLSMSAETMGVRS